MGPIGELSADAIVDSGDAKESSRSTQRRVQFNDEACEVVVITEAESSSKCEVVDGTIRTQVDQLLDEIQAKLAVSVTFSGRMHFADAEEEESFAQVSGKPVFVVELSVILGAFAAVCLALIVAEARQFNLRRNFGYAALASVVGACAGLFVAVRRFGVTLSTNVFYVVFFVILQLFIVGLALAGARRSF